MSQSNSVMPTYGRMSVRFTHGEGIWLYDDQGNRFQDALGGLAVTALGHAHPAVAEAVADQASRLIHTSNLYRIEAQERLAAKLTELAGMDNVFFCNSGAEANEAGIKVARAYGHSRGVELPSVVVTNNSFHGRTMGSLSATGNPKVHVGFEPLLPGFVHVPFDDIEALRQAAENHAGVVAVLVEPIQGEGGVVVPRDDYLRELRALCDEHEWLLMLDEIQCGMGRTGRWFAHQHAGIQPDVMTLAKALGNGVPIGACLARGTAAGMLGPGSHGSTFGGNPLACRAALAVIENIESEDLLRKTHERGEQLKSLLASGLAGLNCVVDIRGKGMMIGVELDRDCSEIVELAMNRGVLLNVTAGRVVRMLPAYITDAADIERLAQVVVESVREWNGGSDANA
ncbi:MAG: aspartate aminotransferase family protein [Gammaproteobacteria bacterium]